MKKAIFWFRQDLRTHDNTGLSFAYKNFDQILPVFIFDDYLIDKFSSNDPRFSFLCSALVQLDKQLKSLGNQLHIMRGDAKVLIPRLANKTHCEAVYTNQSYGLHGVSRDMEIQKSLAQDSKELVLCEDFLLVDPREIKAMKVFTPYFKHHWLIQAQDRLSRIELSKLPRVDFVYQSDPYKFIDPANKLLNRSVDGFEDILTSFDFANYENTRDMLDIKDGTSKLSPYIRFGLLSIREVYDAGKSYPKFVSQLAWRDFRQQIMYYFPDTHYIEFMEKRRNIPWQNDEKHWQAWCDARTGYPIIDAAMRALQHDKYLHNRARMIVGSFLTKDLLIDWRWGEQFFAKHLLDYDVNVNIGSWQWIASVGADPKPLRIFSPIRQAQRFDPQAIFIKKRLPELAHYEPAQLHDPLTHSLNYVRPIVNHTDRVHIAKQAYLGQD